MSDPAEFIEHEASTRLDELGLLAQDLSDAVEWGGNHLAYSTANEPPSGPGQIVWIKTVRGLREKLIPHGWTPNNSDNYATVVSPQGNVAIAVAAGDEKTGKLGRPNPTTKNRKGRNTRQVVGENQLSFKEISAGLPPAQEIKGKQTWILLIAVDEERDEIVAELSLPEHVGKNGFISEWRERIILRSTPFGAPNEAGEDDDGTPPIEIDIQPR